MEGEACLYSKFGFCKFKDECKRQHYKQICEDSSSCKSMKICPKRHPKVCKRYDTENECRFGAECSYQHKTSVKSLEQNELKEKVKQMEIVMKELALKVTCLESELNNVKLNLDTKTFITDSKDKECFEDRKSNCEKPLAVTNNSEIIKEKPEEKLVPEFKCDECEYVVKKKSTLYKHIKTKHAEHECKSCNLKFKTALEALKHSAKDHSSNIQEDKRESESTEKYVSISETHLEVEEEDGADQIESDKFKCKKCKDIFFKKDALIEYTEGGQNMCSLCTILNYGKN